MVVLKIKEVQRKFDRIDASVPVDRSFDVPGHCTSRESCALLARQVYDVLFGGDE